MPRPKTLEDLYNDLEEKCPDVEYVSGYIKYHKPCLFRCKKTKKEFLYQPTMLFLMQKCFCEDCRKEREIKGHQLCNQKRIKKEEQIKIDIAKHNPDVTYISGYKNNKSKIKIKCNHCGWVRFIIAQDLFKKHKNCPCCSDGISYPNKYFRAMLRQLKLKNLDFEYTTKQMLPYHYDAYFELNNKKYLIEIDGGFHYIESNFQSLAKNEKNDIIKTELAKQFKYNLIRIKIEVSDYNKMPEVIKNSEINNILDLNNIDWELCETKACKNIVKEIWDEYINNPFVLIKDLAKKYNISRNSASSYLIKGEKLGLFYYNRGMRPVVLKNKELEEKIFFQSISACEKYLKKEKNIIVDHRIISNHFKNNIDSFYIDNYIIELFSDYVFKKIGKEEFYNEYLSFKK